MIGRNICFISWNTKGINSAAKANKVTFTVSERGRLLFARDRHPHLR